MGIAYIALEILHLPKLVDVVEISYLGIQQ
jgi:hypothetical protein